MPTSNSLNISSSGIVKFDGTATFSGVTTTQYNALVGDTSNGIASVAPSATSGVPLISQGASANPTFGTAVVAGGGTGRTTLTNHGVLVGAATSAITQLATGSANQVLLSGGASADPTWSTATYPATAGTSGNVLTSDGTNWTSSAPSGGNLLLATGTLTNSQIKNIRGTPVQAIAAPGSGKLIVPISAGSRLNYGGTSAFTAAASQTISLYYTSTSFPASMILSSNTLIGNTASYEFFVTGGLSAGVATNKDNAALYMINSVATEISGNAANDNTISWFIFYYIWTF